LPRPKLFSPSIFFGREGRLLFPPLRNLREARPISMILSPVFIDERTLPPFSADMLALRSLFKYRANDLSIPFPPPLSRSTYPFLVGFALFMRCNSFQFPLSNLLAPNLQLTVGGLRPRAFPHTRPPDPFISQHFFPHTPHCAWYTHNIFFFPGHDANSFRLNMSCARTP